MKKNIFLLPSYGLSFDSVNRRGIKIMKYGLRLKQCIKIAGYGQNEFAEKIDVSSSKMSFWCNSEYPPLEAIELICNKLEIPVYKFFTTDEDLKNLTGIDPMLIKIGQWVDHMPGNVQIED